MEIFRWSPFLRNRRLRLQVNLRVLLFPAPQCNHLLHIRGHFLIYFRLRHFHRIFHKIILVYRRGRLISHRLRRHRRHQYQDFLCNLLSLFFRMGLQMMF